MKTMSDQTYQMLVSSYKELSSSRHNHDSPRYRDALRRAGNALSRLESEVINKAAAKKGTGSQKKAILSILLAGDTITPDEAQKLCGCRRLAARISELKDAGYNITKTTVKNPDGNEYAQYKLENRQS